MLNNPVYIVDYEVISPIGIGKDDLFESIKSNSTADSLISRIDANGIPFRKAAEVKEDISHLYESEIDEIKKLCSYDRKLELLAACYGKMKPEIEHLIACINPLETGVILGIGADVAPFELFENEMIRYMSEDLNPLVELYSDVNSNGIKLNMTNNAYDIYSIYLAEKFNAVAFQKSILTACVSSTQAIAMAYDSIKNREAEVVIAGGVDSLVNLLALISFGKLGVISESTDNPCCYPFDQKRQGTLAGECAGIVIMASEDFVKRNNLKPVAQILGYGNTLDAYKITAPDPQGTSIAKSIKNAVDSSGISVEMIDYINAHGTGTRHNDLLELKSFEAALGPEARKIPISSTKDRHGHAIAAAGVQELCVVLELMKHGYVPKNLNLETPCDDSFNLVRENFSKRINYALSSNFAFGGINTVLAIKNERE